MPFHSGLFFVILKVYLLENPCDLLPDLLQKSLLDQFPLNTETKNFTFLTATAKLSVFSILDS